MAAGIPLIEIRDLVHCFPDGTTALDKVSLTIEKDSFTIICGENGSGKTVLMKHLNGILEPTEGEVLISGIPVSRDFDNARRTIGFVFQNSDTQIVAQTVRDDIAFGPENLGCTDNQIERLVVEAAEAVDLTAVLEQSPHRLSGGEKKKTAIAGIIAMQPELIVFDEPFAGLDYRGVRMLLEKILELRSRGTGIIVITHDLEKVLAHADDLAVMSGGRLIGFGAPSRMLSTAADAGMRIPGQVSISSMSWLKD